MSSSIVRWCVILRSIDVAEKTSRQLSDVKVQFLLHPISSEDERERCLLHINEVHFTLI
jgi:hypothetical protein